MTFPRKRIGAGVLFVDERERVLLVEPTYKRDWEIPGGVVEDGESPRSAAAREVREELGLRIAPGRLLAVDWVPPGVSPDDGLMLIFEGGELDCSGIVLADREIRSWRWCDGVEAAERLVPVLARRAAAAVRARRDGVTVYLEDGSAVVR